MRDEQIERNRKNYKNFAGALIVIFLFILLIGIVGYLGFLKGREDRTAYEAGRATGRIMRYYIDNGLFFGNIIAIIASLEKNRSFLWAVIHGIFGWGYVVHYAVTRKTVISE